MNCPTCGLQQPQYIPHTTLDDCAIALTAAQDAVRSVIEAQIRQIEELQTAQAITANVVANAKLKKKGGD